MSLYLLKNTSDDRQKVTLHRAASGMTAVIQIAGVRLDPGMQMYIEKEHFERIRELLVKNYQDGALEVLEVTPKEDAQIRVLCPERIPTPNSNPHAEYNPAAQEVEVPHETVEDQNPTLQMLKRPMPGIPPLPSPVAGADLADPTVVHAIPPEVSGAVIPARPLIEQAVLPGDVLAREAHIHVEGEQGPGTQAIESVTQVSGDDAPQNTPPLPSPEASEPKRPADPPPGGQKHPGKKKLM